MDRGKIMARQLVDIVISTAVQCSGEDRIFDNCRDRLHNHASFGFSRVAAETIEPRHGQEDIAEKIVICVDFVVFFGICVNCVCG